MSPLPPKLSESHMHLTMCMYKIANHVFAAAAWAQPGRGGRSSGGGGDDNNGSGGGDGNPAPALAPASAPASAPAPRGLGNGGDAGNNTGECPAYAEPLRGEGAELLLIATTWWEAVQQKLCVHQHKRCLCCMAGTSCMTSLIYKAQHMCFRHCGVTVTASAAAASDSCVCPCRGGV